MNINLTLIGQLVAFIAFVGFCMRYVWPPITAAMAERQSKIAGGLAAADRAGHDLELAQKRATEQLAEAKREAAGIVEAANKRAQAVVEDGRQSSSKAERTPHQPCAVGHGSCVRRWPHLRWPCLAAGWQPRPSTISTS